MIRGLWDRETVALILLAAFAPVAAMWLWFEGADAVLRLALALGVSGGWHMAFMLARAQPPSVAGAVSALSVAMLSPPELGVGPLVLAISFGTVVGELIFGGWGRNVVNPATVTLAFIAFGFPGHPWPSFVEPVFWAAMPAAAIGILYGVLPVRVIAGAGLVAVGAFALGLDAATALPVGALVLVLLVCDPVASAATPLGRWLYGAGYAALVLLFDAHWGGASTLEHAVAAALLASLAAPVLDEAAIALWIARRKARHGA